MTKIFRRNYRRVFCVDGNILSYRSVALNIPTDKGLITSVFGSLIRIFERLSVNIGLCVKILTVNYKSDSMLFGRVNIRFCRYAAVKKGNI